MQLSALLVPSLVLHTTGAKSGEPRDAPLMYTPDGQGRAIVAGTQLRRRAASGVDGESARAPGCRDHRPRHGACRCAPGTIPDDERDAAWARIEAQWPGYRGVRARLRAYRAAVPAAAGARAAELERAWDGGRLRIRGMMGA